MIRRLVLAALATVTLAATGCTGGGTTPAPNATSGAAGSYPVTVASPGGPVTVDKQPVRVVSMSPTATEMLFAIGAGKQVTAADSLSNYPAEAPRTDLSSFKPNAEAIAARNPDLVVVAYDTDKLVDSLQKLKIPVYVATAAKTIDDTYRQLDDLGRLTGHTPDADGLVTRMKGDIDTIVKGVPHRSKKLTYYYELDQQLYTATSKTFIGSLFARLDLENVADKADKTSNGYPQLSGEYVLQANPDLVFLADSRCCQQNKATVSSRAGWNNLTAVKTGQVYELDDDIASRWGPRTVDLLRTVAAALAKAPA